MKLYQVKKIFLEIAILFEKIRRNGVKWFWQRLIVEYRIPQTAFGKKLKPINFFFYRLVMVVSRSMPFFQKKDHLSAKTLYFFYDFEILPIAFNFIEFLIAANAHRRSLSLSHLYVIFVPGPYEGLRREMDDYEALVDKDARHWRKYHILFSAIHLIPSCSGFSACASRFEADQFHCRIPSDNIYPNGYTVQFPIAPCFYDSARSHDKEIMAIEATPKALKYIQQWLMPRAFGRKIITITLRQHNYMPKRNSNINAWAAFAQELDSKKYFVVIVPDVEVAMNMPLEPLATFEHCTPACCNIELRVALYECAYLNLGINNGPFNLCWLNKKCRYLMFKIMTEEVPQTTEEALRKYGFVPGTSPPFVLEHQRWIWEPDTQEVMEREFHAMCRYLENSSI